MCRLCKGSRERGWRQTDELKTFDCSEHFELGGEPGGDLCELAHVEDQVDELGLGHVVNELPGDCPKAES